MQEIYRDNFQAELTLSIYLAWVVLSTVLMLNLLIGMMNQSFKQAEKRLVRLSYLPFASLVLKYERLLSGQEVFTLTFASIVSADEITNLSNIL